MSKIDFEFDFVVVVAHSEKKFHQFQKVVPNFDFFQILLWNQKKKEEHLFYSVLFGVVEDSTQ